jgi:hypothetical protein
MVFSGTLSKPATVTMRGNAATVDVNNNFRGTGIIGTVKGWLEQRIYSP